MRKGLPGMVAIAGCSPSLYSISMLESMQSGRDMAIDDKSRLLEYCADYDLDDEQCSQLVVYCLSLLTDSDLMIESFEQVSKVACKVIGIFSDTPSDGKLDESVEFMVTVIEALPSPIDYSNFIFGSYTQVLLSILHAVCSLASVYSNKKKLFLRGIKTILPAFSRWLDWYGNVNLDEKEVNLIQQCRSIDLVFDSIIRSIFFGTPKYVDEISRYSFVNKASQSVSQSMYRDFFMAVTTLTRHHKQNKTLSSRLLMIYSHEIEEVLKKNHGINTDMDSSLSLVSRKFTSALLQFARCIATSFFDGDVDTMINNGKDDKNKSNTKTKTKLKNASEDQGDDKKQNMVTMLKAMNGMLRSLSICLKGAIPNHLSMFEYIVFFQQVSKKNILELRDETESAISCEHLESLNILLGIDHRIVLEFSLSPTYEEHSDSMTDLLFSITTAWSSCSNDKVKSQAEELFKSTVTVMGRLRRMHELINRIFSVAISIDKSISQLLCNRNIYTHLLKELSTLPIVQVSLCIPALLLPNYDADVYQHDEWTRHIADFCLRAIKTQTTILSCILDLPFFDHVHGSLYISTVFAEVASMIEKCHAEDSDTVLLAIVLMSSAGQLIVDASESTNWQTFTKTAIKLLVQDELQCTQLNHVKRKRRPDTETSSIVDRNKAILTLSAYLYMSNVIASSWITDDLMSNVEIIMAKSDEKICSVLMRCIEFDTIFRCGDNSGTTSKNTHLTNPDFIIPDLILSVCPIWIHHFRADGMLSSESQNLFSNLVSYLIKVLYNENVPHALYASFNTCTSLLLEYGSFACLSQVSLNIIKLELEKLDKRPRKAKRPKHSTAIDQYECLSHAFRNYFDCISPENLQIIAKSIVVHLVDLLEITCKSNCQHEAN